MYSFLKNIFSLILVFGGGLVITSFSPQPFSPTPYRFNLPQHIPAASSPAGNVTTIQGVELGHKLFYDPLLSADHTIACSSCHIQEKGFADNAKLSKGIGNHHALRNTMPLINMAWISKYFWDGRANAIEELVKFPLTNKNEMGKDLQVLESELMQSAEYRKMFYEAFGTEQINVQTVSMALAQYVRTITSFKSPADEAYPKMAALMADKKVKQPAALKVVFGFSDKTIETLSLCEKCHNTFTYGNVQMKNNGLDMDYENDKGLGDITKNEEDVGLFKAPSFRNLIFTGPYMHDGRFATLEEVIDHYSLGIKPARNLDPLLKDSEGKPVRLNLGDREKKEVLYFLKVLMTDSNILKIQS